MCEGARSLGLELQLWAATWVLGILHSAWNSTSYYFDYFHNLSVMFSQVSSREKDIISGWRSRGCVKYAMVTGRCVYRILLLFRNQTVQDRHLHGTVPLLSSAA